MMTSQKKNTINQLENSSSSSEINAGMVRKSKLIQAKNQRFKFTCFIFSPRLVLLILTIGKRIIFSTKKGEANASPKITSK